MNKKVKIILFDIDGVLIRLPYYFSKVLEEQGCENAGKILDSFYHGDDNNQCAEGRADTRDTIMPYLQKFGWDKTAADYLQQQFNFESQYLDKNLISLVKQLQEEGITCCLSTDQEKYRAKYLLEEMDFQSIFTEHFVSCRLGYRKCQPGFWKQVIAELKKGHPNLNPSEIVYFDDKPENIEVALKFGIRAFLFENVEQFNQDINSLGVL